MTFFSAKGSKWVNKRSNERLTYTCRPSWNCLYLWQLTHLSDGRLAHTHNHTHTRPLSLEPFRCRPGYAYAPVYVAPMVIAFALLVIWLIRHVVFICSPLQTATETR